MTTSDLQPDKPPRIDDEPWTKYICLFVALGFIAMIIYMAPVIWSPTETKAAKWFVVGSDLFILYLTRTVLIASANLIIDERGVSHKILGRVTKSILWQDIKEIDSDPVKWNSSFTRGIAIYKKDKKIHFFLMYTNNISNVHGFIETLNFYIAKHDITVRWADEYMTDPKDYREIKQMPPPPYGDDES
jgi:hypothetical protein